MSLISAVLISVLTFVPGQDSGRHGFLQITKRPAFSEQTEADFSILAGSLPGSPRYGVVVRTPGDSFNTTSDACPAVSRILTRYASLAQGQPYVPGLGAMPSPLLRADADTYTVSGRFSDEDGGWPHVTVTARSGAVAAWARESLEALLACPRSSRPA